MATTRRRFFNPHAVTHGALEVNTIQQISYNKTWQRLAAQGDDDVTDSFQAKTNLQVSGTIVIQDAIQADALLNAESAPLHWEGKAEGEGAPKTIDVTGVEFFSLAENDSHNAVDSITLGWSAYSPTGVDPVTVDVSA